MNRICKSMRILCEELTLSIKIVLGSKLNVLFFTCAPMVAIGTRFNLLNEAACFLLAGLALIPCAERLSLVTEHIAERTNGTIGALLNATFGNAPELLISSAALRMGFYRLVQLTLLGSILTNLLFVFGLSSLVGGLRWQRQRIRITSGNVLIGMLFVALGGLFLPTALKLARESSIQVDDSTYNITLSFTETLGSTNSTQEVDDILHQSELKFSRTNAIIMIASYVLFILFQLGTHKDEFDYSGDEYAAFGGGHNIVRVPTMHPAHLLPPDVQYNIFCLDLGFRSIFSLCDRDLKRPVFQDHPTSETNNTENTLDPNVSLVIPPICNGDPDPILSDVEMPTTPAQERLFRRSPSKTKFKYNSLSSMSVSEDDSKYKDHTTSPIIDEEPSTNKHEVEDGPWMSLRTSLVWLGVVTYAISSLSDVIVDTIDGFAHRSKLSEVFISVIIIPYFSNIAEQVSAVIFAFRNKMDLCIGVSVGSAAQVALFILPGTVLVGWYMDRPMSLYFRGYEAVCFLLSVICVGSVLQGGSTNWMSGFIFICIYFMIASGFSFHVDERLS